MISEFLSSPKQENPLLMSRLHPIRKGILVAKTQGNLTMTPASSLNLPREKHLLLIITHGHTSYSSRKSFQSHSTHISHFLQAESYINPVVPSKEESHTFAHRTPGWTGHPVYPVCPCPVNILVSTRA